MDEGNKSDASAPEPPHPLRSRVTELASEQAKSNHYASRRWFGVADNPKHPVERFDLCPHRDCALVRAGVTPPHASHPPDLAYQAKALDLVADTLIGDTPDEKLIEKRDKLGAIVRMAVHYFRTALDVLAQLQRTACVGHPSQADFLDPSVPNGGDSGQLHARFRPCVVHDVLLDCIRVILKDCSAVEVRVDERLDLLYASYGERECVGFTLNGIAHACHQKQITLPDKLPTFFCTPREETRRHK